MVCDMLHGTGVGTFGHDFDMQFEIEMNWRCFSLDVAELSAGTAPLSKE